MGGKIKWSFFVVVTLLPLICKANSFTAFTSMAIFELLIGNILIAVLEKYAVQWIFKIRVNLLAVILANYFSMFVGMEVRDLIM